MNKRYSISSRQFLFLAGFAILVALVFDLGVQFIYARNVWVEEVAVTVDAPVVAPPPPFVVTHQSVPDRVRGVYITSYVAGSAARRAELLRLLDGRRFNAAVIDIKNDTGYIGYKPTNETLEKTKRYQKWIPDVRDLIATLHSKGIYVIGRISVFQDPVLATERDDLAIKSKLTGKAWKDRKGQMWVDPASTEVWDYVESIARDAYFNQGFDEVNFDYVRFPTDGNLDDFVFPFYKSEVRTKRSVMAEFYRDISGRMRKAGILSSVDLFGLVTSRKDDLGIGQVVEDAFVFSFVSPMVYPSHYGPGYANFDNPAEHPYEIMKLVMGEGIARAKEASTTPSIYRPWIQDFDLGADYTPERVRDQIRALDELGIHSWLVWNPASRYTEEAFH